MSIPAPPSLSQFEDWAEDSFQTIGTGTDVVVNAPRRDRRGWDFIAEWDVPAVPGLPSDKQRTARTARIQVKSSRQTKPVARLKLSNALKFAEAVDPCFVVLYWLDKRQNQVEIYIKHFDEALVARTLKRAREADRDGETDLHKINFLVPMSVCDMHTHDLILWLKEQCLDIPSVYTKQKAHHHETVGYEDPRLFGNMTFNHSHADALIEHAVGLPTTFNPSWIELRESRFGIPASIPFVAGEPSHFEIRTTPKPAAIIFRTADGREARFDGELRSFQLPGYEPKGVLLAAFSSESVTGRVYSDLRIQINYSLLGPAVHDARHLQTLLRMFLMLFDGGVTATLAIDNKELDQAPITEKPPAINERLFRWAYDMTEALLKHIKRADKPRLSVAQLIDAFEDVERFAACVIDGVMTLKVELEDPSAALRTFSGMLSYAYVPVGSFTYAVFYRQPFLSQRIEGDLLIVQFGSPDIIETWARAGSSDKNMPAIRRKFAKLRNRAPGGTVYAYDGDMIEATTKHVDITVTGDTSNLKVFD